MMRLLLSRQGRRVQQEVEGALRILGDMTADEIASFLAAQHIRGDRRHHPLAVYLQALTQFPYVGVYEDTWAIEARHDGTRWGLLAEGSLPLSALSFGWRWKAGAYQALLGSAS